MLIYLYVVLIYSLDNDITNLILKAKFLYITTKKIYEYKSKIA